MAEEAPGRRRAIVAALAAVALVAAALAAILAVGGISPPSFPSLRDDPDPSIPGRVAYTTGGPDDGTCLTVVAAGGGEPRTLHCEDELLGARISWDGPGEVVLTGADDLGGIAVTVDVADGEVLERRRVPPDEQPRLHPSPPPAVTERPDGAYVTTGGLPAADSGQARVVLVEPDGSERTLLSVEGPRGYRFTDAQFSPDGQWVLVRDDAGRLLVVHTREGDARLLTTDATNPVWGPDA